MTSKKQQKIKNLTWKYFWEQKVVEAGRILLMTIIIGGAVFLVSLVGKVMNLQLGGTCRNTFDCFFMDVFLGLLVLFSLAVFIGILYMFFSMIFDWFKSNYYEANQRAKKEVKQYGNRRRKGN